MCLGTLNRHLKRMGRVNPTPSDGLGAVELADSKVANDRKGDVGVVVVLYGIELIAPHRSNRRTTTQDKRRLRQYRHRWNVERLFAWLQDFRRVVIRYQRHAENFLGMLHLGCCLILLRHL